MIHGEWRLGHHYLTGSSMMIRMQMTEITVASPSNVYACLSDSSDKELRRRHASCGMQTAGRESATLLGPGCGGVQHNDARDRAFRVAVAIPVHRVTVIKSTSFSPLTFQQLFHGRIAEDV